MNFNTEEDEILVDRKIVKVIDMMPAELQPRFKALYINDNYRAVLGDKLDCEIEALSELYISKKKPLHEERKRITDGEVTAFENEIEIFDKAHVVLEEIVHKIVRTPEEHNDYAEMNSMHEGVDVTHL